VYICEKVAGEDAGQRAIVKARVEYLRSSCGEEKWGFSLNSSIIPMEDVPNPKEPQTPSPPSKEINTVTIQELQDLKLCIAEGCTSTPRPLGQKKERSKEHSWLPGDYGDWSTRYLKNMSGEL
jgi:hypothetical protein